MAKNLGQVKAIHVGTTAPTNTNMLWRDTSITPKTYKEYIDSSGIWEPLVTTGGGEGSGTFDPVQDITALKAIDTTIADDWPDKWALIVEDQANWYRLDRDSGASESLPNIVEPTTGVGRWIKTPIIENVALTQLADQAALTILANATNGIAKPTAVAGSASETLFGRNASNVLTFVKVATGYIVDLAITTAKIAANAVTFAKFIQSTGNTVVGKIGAGTGDFTQVPITNIYDGIVESKTLRTLTSNDILDNGDCVILLDATAATRTAQLPDPSIVENLAFTIMKIAGGNNGVVDPQTYNINGSTTDITLPALYDYIKVFSDGTQYLKIGGNV